MDSAKVLSAKDVSVKLKQGLGTFNVFNVNSRDDRRGQEFRAQTVGRRNGG